MATIDISREAFDPRKRYSSVRMQQGRVITDDDWNENERIENEDRRRARVDVIGPSGSPDQGFRITDPKITKELIDFDILPGSFYLGGLRLEIDQKETYRLQKDWLQQPSDLHPATPLFEIVDRYDLVYLEAWQQPVAAVEDSELFEVALGGPDTSMRIRSMYRIRLEPDVVQSNDCALAWQKLVKEWTANHKGALNEEYERIPDVTLTVSYSSSGVQNDLCTPSVAGGYLGAENQAIRVQLVDNDHFTWGFDNASPLYRVEVNTTGKTVTLLTDPKDQAHWPLAGQIVEILPWSAVLPNGEKLAVIQKHLSIVESSYDPDDPDEGTLTLTTPLHTGFGKEWTSRDDKTELQEPSEYFFMRVWNRGADRTSEPEIAFTPGTPVSLGKTGLEITITGDDCVSGDYWIIAARPETPNKVVPWEFEKGLAPHGVRRFYAPLALIQWKPNRDGGIEGQVVHDCRRRFRPLTDQQTCCSYTVGDGVHSQGDFANLQEAIDSLPPSGGEICVLPGIYTENVLIEEEANIIISGCGERSKIISKTSSGAFGAANPVIHVKNSQNIRIESLDITADNTGIGILLEGSPPEKFTFGNVAIEGPAPLREIMLADLHISAATRSAIEAHGGQFITIRECRILMSDVPGSWPGVFFVGEDALIENNVIKVQPSQDVGGAVVGSVLVSAGLGGLQLGGTSERVRIINNLIQWGIGNGITLGSIKVVDESGNDTGELYGWVINADVPCCTSRPGSTYVPSEEDVDEGTRKVSAGPLYEVHIERNRILDMGLNGIGVVGFFNLDEKDEFISAERLTILDNQIRRCLKRPLEVIPPEMINNMGYGGIALADAEYLVIRENVIEDNGPSHLEPICGVFVLHGEGIDITGNRILNNGAKTSKSATRAKDGRRGGINIVYGIAPTLPVTIGRQSYPRQDGVPAIKIHDNIVSAPLGRALSLNALGPVSVVANQFTSRGMILKFTSPSFVASTVAILNLGVSNELYGQLMLFSSIGSGQAKLDSAPSVTEEAVFIRTGLDDLRLGQYLANGNVLFSNNQCTLDLLEKGVNFSVSSIFILSLDDIGFHNNQCDCRLLDVVLSQAIMFGISLRVSDNRFKEGLRNALYSAVTLGMLNMTTDNQATHCLLIRGWANMIVNQPNRVLLEGFVPGICERYGNGKMLTNF